MKKNRAVAIIASLIAVILLVGIAGGWALFGTRLKAANTVREIEDGLYTMTYAGDYGFDEFLAQGGADTDAKMGAYIASFLSHGFYTPDETAMEQGEYGCSTLSVRSPTGGALFGRNYDWEDCSAMIVHAKPDDGYASISTCCLDFLGFGDNWRIEGMTDQFMSLAALYVPLDGMNEMGLCVADLMAGDDVETHQDTGKPDLTITAAIRLLLDRAADVEEAVGLLSQYDLHSSIGRAHHFAISDASGSSVVVEYINNEMFITQTPIVTNHYLTEGDMFGTGSRASQKRFDTLTVLLQDAGGVMTASELRDCLNTVAASNYPDNDISMWSIVFDTETRTGTFYWRERFDVPHSFTIGGD